MNNPAQVSIVGYNPNHDVPGGKKIGVEAFRASRAFGYLIISNGTLEIGDRAFKGSSVQSVYVPASVTSIGPEAFANCPRLHTVKFQDKEQFWDPETGKVVFQSKLASELHTIGIDAFADCPNLRRMTFPSSLRFFSNGYTASIGPNPIDIAPQGADWIFKALHPTLMKCLLNLFRHASVPDPTESVRPIALTIYTDRYYVTRDGVTFDSFKSEMNTYHNGIQFVDSESLELFIASAEPDFYPGMNGSKRTKYTIDQLNDQACLMPHTSSDWYANGVDPQRHASPDRSKLTLAASVQIKDTKGTSAVAIGPDMERCAIKANASDSRRDRVLPYPAGRMNASSVSNASSSSSQPNPKCKTSAKAKLQSQSQSSGKRRIRPSDNGYVQRTQPALVHTDTRNANVSAMRPLGNSPPADDSLSNQ